MGGISKGIIGIFLHSNACLKCGAIDNRLEEEEEHEFPKNSDGSSKSTEDGVILNMVEYAFRYRCFIIDVIVSNIDSTIQSVLKHPSRGARGQVMNSSKGKLYEYISVPFLLADPSYRTKFVYKHIFSTFNNGKAQICGYTRADDIRIKKYWG